MREDRSDLPLDLVPLRVLRPDTGEDGILGANLLESHLGALETPIGSRRLSVGKGRVIPSSRLVEGSHHR